MIRGSLAGVMSASRSDADRFVGAIVPIRRIWRSDLPQDAHPSPPERRVGGTLRRFQGGGELPPSDLMPGSAPTLSTSISVAPRATCGQRAAL